MKPVCYLDLDGVLVDFVGGVLTAHGRTLDRGAVRWGLEDQLGIDPAVFWAACGYDFWASLGWTTEGERLLARVERIFGDHVALMTSPCDTPGSVEGKVEWVRRNLPAYRRRLFVGPAKHLTAGPLKVLVDDHDANVDKFRDHGGMALMPPRPWNRRRDECGPGGTFDPDSFANELATLVGVP